LVGCSWRLARSFFIVNSLVESTRVTQYTVQLVVVWSIIRVVFLNLIKNVLENGTNPCILDDH
jgi:hypothetical protein